MTRGGLFVLTGFVFLSFILVSSCKEEAVIDYPSPADDAEIPADLNSLTLNYEPFLNVKYGLRYPFLKVKNDFYFFETYLLQLFKYSLIDSTWQGNFSYSTDEYISTSKFYFAEGDSVILASYFENKHSLDIYSVNKKTLALNLLKKDLLIGENLGTIFQSTVFWDRGRIIILLHPANKILTIDMKNFSVMTSQDYHLSGIRHDSQENSTATVGKAGRNVFLYYNSYKRLFKLNIDSYVFTEISLPKFLTSRMNYIWNKSGVVGNYFCFWPNDSFLTLCYDVNKDIWLTGGQNPFYQKGYTQFDYTYDENSIYYQEGTVIKRISVK